MTKLCIFDLDGTLINSLQDLAEAMNFALQNSGFPTHPTEDYRQLVGSGVSVLADRAVGECQPYTAAVKDRILSDFSDYYTVHCLDHTRPYPGIDRLLQQLRQNGILCAVNSNKPDAFTKAIVDRLFPSKPFAAIRGKVDGCERKPSPEGALAIMKLADCTPENTVYIGDSNVDGQTAANAGVRFYGVSWGFRSVQELLQSGAAAVAESPEELLRCVIS